jgi:hypothetical protein
MTPRYFLLLLSLPTILLYSCKEVTFPEPQPLGVKELAEIPANIRGKYLVADSAERDKDTLTVESWGYHVGQVPNPKWLDKGVLSDSLIVKYHKGYYFFNFRIKERWFLRLLHQNQSGSLDFLSLKMENSEMETALVRDLSKYLEVKKVEDDGDTFYEINPTRRELTTLIKKGLFTGVTLEKM